MIRKKQTQPLGEVIAEIIRGSALEKPLMERKVVSLWPQVMGETVSRLTGDMEVKNGVLYVHIRSAALRAQLFECRHEVVKKLNEAAGSPALADIRLLG